MRPAVAFLAIALLAGCSQTAKVPFTDLANEYVYTTLSFSPVSASAAGYHEHQKVNLDELLDNYDESELKKVRDYLSGFRRRLDENVQPDALNLEERADYDILTDHLRQWQLELDTIQNYRHNPTLYVELLGSALFTPMVVEYDSIEKRYQHIIARLQRAPALLAQARQNLQSSPQVWTQVAMQENDGNYELVNKTLREKCPATLKAGYETAAAGALKAIDEFRNWLKNTLATKDYDWRLGKEKYAAKFAPVLGLKATPEQVLGDAEAELKRVRQQMLEISLPLHQKMYPAAKDRSDVNAVVGGVLRKIAEQHATPQTYFDAAKRDLAEAREFVKSSGIMALPSSDNLQVIETPEFMRGIYSVGGFNPAPPMQPALGAFYWLTPIPPNWPRERIESKLREYNTYGLKLLTIHEAIPGHYLQFEYANRVEPRDRRLIRALYGNGPYIEGWAVYATEVMLDEGYLNRDPQLRLTFLKQQLRMIANAILDVRLHTQGMTDQEALDLMIGQCFQEKEEATGKLQRAKLSSVQLPTYFTGWREWWRIRRAVEAKQGASFRLAAFHERALKAGAVPMPSLERVLSTP
jgi:uncharacterized protein (DUF885 family)